MYPKPKVSGAKNIRKIFKYLYFLSVPIIEYLKITIKKRYSPSYI